LVFYEGEFRRDKMRRGRLNEDEIRAGMRQHSIRELSHVHPVVLEINGTFSVLRARGHRSSLLEDVVTDREHRHGRVASYEAWWHGHHRYALLARKRTSPGRTAVSSIGTSARATTDQETGEFHKT
jgi:YetF C-terminal domain